MGIQLLQARMPALDRWEDLAVPILVLIEGSCFRNLPQHHFIPFLDRTSRVSGRFSCRFPFHKPSWPVVSFYIRLSITIYHDSLKITAPKMPIVHQATIVLVAVLDVRMSIVFDSLVAAPQRGRVDGDSSGYQASKKCEFNFTIQKSSTIEWYVYIYIISLFHFIKQILIYLIDHAGFEVVEWKNTRIGGAQVIFRQTMINPYEMCTLCISAHEFIRG